MDRFRNAAPPAASSAPSAAGQRQDQALGQQPPHDAQAPGAQRHADS
jgi:hypothetical protein